MILRNTIALLLVIGLSFTSVSQQKAGMIEVSGISSMNIAPDQAVFSLTVVSSNTNFSKCLDGLNAQVSKLKAALGKAGIDEKDIKTVAYNISEKYSYESGQRKLAGHKAIHSLKVEIPLDKEKMKSVNTALFISGVEVKMTIKFTLSNTETYKAELLTLAVANAKLKAETLAKAAGVELGAIKKMAIGNTSTPSFSPRNIDMAPSMTMMDEPEEMSVNPSDMKLNAQVSIVYFIKQ